MSEQDRLPCTVERFTSWSQFKQFLAEFGEKWVFRGQANAGWDLETSLERHGTPSVLAMQRLKSRVSLGLFEFRTLEDFKRQAQHYLPCGQEPRSTTEWLALMQHHGAPTRLLDWTYSPYVAAYFALEDARHDCAVWAINARELFTSGIRTLEAQYGPIERPKRHYSEEYLDRIFQHQPRGTFVVEPRQRNQRLTVQQGLFLMPGNPDVTFGDSLRTWGNRLPRMLYRLELSLAVKPEALRDLSLMNVNRTTLFPGLDGFAQSLRYDLYTMTDPDFVERIRQAGPGEFDTE